MSAALVRRRAFPSALCSTAILSNRALARWQSTYNHFITGPTASSIFTDEQPPPVHASAEVFTLAVKDNIATADLATQCASGILLAHPSPFEATIVSQLRSHGAVVVGKTNMDEFGMGSHSTNSIHGPVRNPRGKEGTSEEDCYSAGGSSGGSAVAVLLGEADLGLGTDTGGSVRLPAAYTGVVGYKPSYGMISRYGVVPYANSLDTVGFLAQEVGTIRRLVFDTNIYLQHDEYDPTSLSEATRRRCLADQPARATNIDISEITIGIPLEYNIAELDPSIREAWMRTASALKAHGARVVPVSLPSTKQALSAYYILAPAEASSNLAKYDGVRYGVRLDSPDSHNSHNSQNSTLYSDLRGAGFGEEVKRRILLGTYTLSSSAMDNYFLQAQRVRRLVQRDFDRVFARANPLYEPVQFDLSEMPEGTGLEDKRGPVQVDLLLAPTAPTFPPRMSELRGSKSVDAYRNDVFTVGVSLAGIPAVSVPVETGGGFPAGMQIIGQYFDDQRVLDVAERVVQMMRNK